ncbi:MAG: hypothetical protein P8J14_05995 [Emcibacteraceae bacterium]|nr:hypothetical protein [Emcibacteraceae bacterium]
MSNYPDNIRDFDWHPQSPFYVEPPEECKGCGEYFDPDDEMLDEDGYCEECTEDDE